MSLATALPPCRKCRSPLEPGDLRCAICACAAPMATSVPPEARATVLRCDQCGAAITYSAEARGARCGFCGAVMHLEQPVDPMESAEWLVPFYVDPATAHAALRRWLSSLGWFRPSDLATSATIAALRPIHWAAWIFDATALVSWTADSDAGAGRAGWAPHSGQVPMTFNAVLVPASRGLTVAECQKLTPYFHLATARREPCGPPGTMLERFDVQRSAARAIVADAVVATAIERLRNGIIPGTRFRNVRASVLLRGLVTKRFALPTYVLAYHYRGKLYRALVHGQDARWVFGHAPYSVAKILAVIAASLALLALLVGGAVVVAHLG